MGGRGNKGWVSLPIIVLLLAVASLSQAYYVRVQSSYKWKMKLQSVSQEKKIWEKFESEWVLSPDFSQARKSPCQGFCALQSVQNTGMEWWQGHNRLFVQWEKYTEDGSATYYRLCASQHLFRYQCWWWQGKRLLSDGWVTAVD